MRTGIMHPKWVEVETPAPSLATVLPEFSGPDARHWKGVLPGDSEIGFYLRVAISEWGLSVCFMTDQKGLISGDVDDWGACATFVNQIETDLGALLDTLLPREVDLVAECLDIHVRVVDTPHPLAWIEDDLLAPARSLPDTAWEAYRHLLRRGISPTTALATAAPAPAGV